MKTNKMKTKITIIVLCISAITAGCSKSKSKIEPTPSDIKTQTQNQIYVQVKTDSKLGQILTDKEGKTLYYFANDADGANTCTGGCEALWPIFNVENLTADKIAKELDLNDFKTITTGAGKKQITYKGHPLYYYAPKVNNANVQEDPGATSGENVNNVWFVAKPDYTIMLSKAQLIGHDGKNYTSNYTEGTEKTLYFTDARGLTLYIFKNDKKNKNVFTKSDFSNNNVWPVYEQDKIVVPSYLDKALFASIDVSGKKQLTYKGWPLYYFGQDNKVMGSNKGVSFPTPGIWPVPVKDMNPAVE